MPTVTRPRAFAHSTARRTLGELPLPLKATSTSSGSAWFFSCSTNTRVKSVSLASEVEPGDVVGQRQRAERSAAAPTEPSLPRPAAKCDAVAALPPLPQMNTCRRAGARRLEQLDGLGQLVGIDRLQDVGAAAQIGRGKLTGAAVNVSLDCGELAIHDASGAPYRGLAVWQSIVCSDRTA